MKIFLGFVLSLYLLLMTKVSFMCARAWVAYWSEPSENPSVREWLTSRYPELWKHIEGAPKSDAVLTFLLTPGAEAWRMWCWLNDAFVRWQGESVGEEREEEEPRR